jgi:hypothetical protein
VRQCARCPEGRAAGATWSNRRGGGTIVRMKKLLVLAVLVALGVVAAKRLREA